MGINLNGASKDTRDILKRLQKEGCEVRLTGGGHFRISRQGCQSITMAGTPGDRRSYLRVRSDIRKYLGIEL